MSARISLKRGPIGVCAVAIVTVVMVAVFYCSTSTERADRATRANTTFTFSSSAITPLRGTPHFMVSAYADDRVDGWDVRVVSILKKDAIVPFHCDFVCGGGNLSEHSTRAGIPQGSMDQTFPLQTKMVTCRVPATCVDPTHVTLSVRADVDGETALRQSFLPIRNRKTEEEEAEPQVDSTVCISALYGGYNNVLQVAQSLEMYRLLGVGRVVIYNTSCGPDLHRLLQGYVRHEDFVEVLPWPIDQHLTPSSTCRYLGPGKGDIHYYGQMAAHHDCIYRNMERSRYVLLHDIDEIIMPYRHDTLTALLSELREQRPQAAEFRFQMSSFPYDRVKAFRPPQWEGVPGYNILEHIYRVDSKHQVCDGNKMIVRPRMTDEVNVHCTTKLFGSSYHVPADVARVMHVRSCLTDETPDGVKPACKAKPRVDTRLWDFSEKLIAGVDKALGRVGMLRTRHQGE